MSSARIEENFVEIKEDAKRIERHAAGATVRDHRRFSAAARRDHRAQHTVLRICRDQPGYVGTAYAGWFGITGLDQ